MSAPECLVTNTDIPQPIVLADVRVLMGEFEILISYLSVDGERVGLKFSTYIHFSMGVPNDEGLGDHRLYDLGMEHYSIQTLENSAVVENWVKHFGFEEAYEDQMRSELIHLVFSCKERVIEVVAAKEFTVTTMNAEWVHAIE